MTNQSEIARIAEGLSEAERKAVRGNWKRSRWQPEGKWQPYGSRLSPSAAKTLRRTGLVAKSKFFGSHMLTKEGQALRHHLRDESRQYLKNKNDG